MSKIHVTAKRDFLESLTNAKPLDALAEIIWNGFDADASLVQVFFSFNAMDGIDSITVRDNGYGIDRSKVEDFFGNLGDSWKKAKQRQNGRALHGKNGKGRFKGFGLGEKIEWDTNYKQSGSVYTYKIKGSANTLDDFEITDPRQSDIKESGTSVGIYNLKKDFRSFTKDNVFNELCKKFAPYLTEYPGVKLEYNGSHVDPKLVQLSHDTYKLEGIILGNKTSIDAELTIVEWSIPTDRVLHLCDSKGISLKETLLGTSIRAPGFNFTAYIKTEFFRDLDSKDQLDLLDLDHDVQIIIDAVKIKIKEHFRAKIHEKQSKVVERWKEEKIYPYEDKQSLNPVEIAERQVFDILAVNVESYLPVFEDSDEKSKKFTFKLLAQAIKENPDSVQEIITEVLGLKKADQDDLAELLKKTPLSSIISSARIVANRLDFLNGLENLLFDKENKKNLLERDQLHKILDSEAWIFDEEFTLAGSEDRLEEVLMKYLEKLGKREDDLEPVVVGDGKTGRVDLLLHKLVQPRIGEFDYLIVELKRPSQKITSEVIQQIQSYAFAVANDERFRGAKSNWKFIAVSNEFDEYARRMANQRDQPKGRIFVDADQNITVWIKEWSEIINDARSRLHFVNKQLAYQADTDSAKNYLNKAHKKYIPTKMIQENDEAS